jgi:hypothetical protein
MIKYTYVLYLRLRILVSNDLYPRRYGRAYYCVMHPLHGEPRIRSFYNRPNI